MLKYLKRVLNTFVDQIVFTLIALFFLTSVFSIAMDHALLLGIFSGIAGFLYLSALYCYFWNCAGKDWRAIKAARKKDPESPLKFRMYHGFLAALPLTAANSVIALLAAAKGGICATVYRIENFGLIGLILNSDNTLCIPWVAAAAVLPLIVSGIGYIVGKTGFSVTERYLPNLVYSKKRKEK